MTVVESRTCPRCGKTTYNLNDVRERYCPYCKQFEDIMAMRDWWHDQSRMIESAGHCKCGGQMVPHPWRRGRFICERSHWWNRKAHAYIVVNVRKESA